MIVAALILLKVVVAVIGAMLLAVWVRYGIAAGDARQRMVHCTRVPAGIGRADARRP